MTDQTIPGPKAPGQTVPSQAVSPGKTSPGPTIPAQAAPGETTAKVPLVPQQAPAEAPPEPTAREQGEQAPPPVRHHLLRRSRPRRQSAFRRWRKTRPFWGGVLTMLAGLEIAAITGTTYSLILISKSVTFAITVGAVIFVLGLTMWLSPPVSRLVGLLTLLAALVSFITSNLGGFLLGMLLAIIGGGLSFAWEPGRTLVLAPSADGEAGEPGEPGSDRPAASVAVPAQRRPRQRRLSRTADHASAVDVAEE